MNNIDRKSVSFSDSNAMSVIKKLLTGSFVIMFVGICAFVSLLLLMRLI